MPIDSSIAGNATVYFQKDVTLAHDGLLIHLNSAVYDIHMNPENWGTLGC